MRLQDKVAIVTGGSRGIGRAIALRLGSEGARVVVDYVSHPAAAQAVVSEIASRGGEGVAVQADVSDASAVARLVQTTLDRFGTIDILVNNAAIITFTPFLEIPEEQWDRILDVNLKGCFLCCQAVARVMVERKIKGKIIAISSISSFLGGATQAHYCATKAGINLLIKSMAIELGPYGINCNAVLPGVTETDINREDLSNLEKRQGFIDRTPLGLLGQPEDITGAVVFLASDDADWITGATIAADGGISVKLM